MTAIMNEPVPYTGVVAEVTGGGITVRLTGRLGCIRVPWRMVISDNPVKKGEKVHILMSLIEVEN
ncbi:MAG: CBO2463/CBO2479 domain-containing protein [Dethiobacteria bacterium]|jgi:hypothetical protein